MMRSMWRAVLLLTACHLLAWQSNPLAEMEAQLPHAVDPGAIMMVLAINHAAAGNRTAALEWLTKAAGLRQGFDPSAGPRFAAFGDMPAYRSLIERVRHDNPPIERSRVAFTSPKGIITEGIAADPKTGAIYIGSLNRHAILRVTPDGHWQDFTQPGQEGLNEPLGLAVDAASRSLWVCSNSGAGHSVLQFDLDSARLRRRWKLAGDPNGHLLNDLAVMPGGNAWVTDSRAGALYHAAKGATELTEAHMGRDFPAANGITPAPGGQRLYVSCFPEGVVIVDIAAKTVRPLRRPAGMTLASIDGLYWHKGTLYGIQNTWIRYRVAAWKLNAAGDAIESQTILDRAAPGMKDPTTGVFLGDTFHYIANSELEHWKDHNVIEANGIRPIRIRAIEVGN